MPAFGHKVNVNLHVIINVSFPCYFVGHRYKFVPSILIPDRIIQRLEQRQRSFRCTSEGYFADPNDCTKFYRCVPNPGSPNYFDQYSFECPPGTAFDDRIKTCYFISAVPGCGI